nr:hypothetical protein [Mucilaginibacter sp. FT3.2]
MKRIQTNKIAIVAYLSTKIKIIIWNTEAMALYVDADC